MTQMLIGRERGLPVICGVPNPSSVDHRSLPMILKRASFVTGSISTVPGGAPETWTGSKSIPQMGHCPGSSCTIWGCIPDW